jgi:hypothetical protein
MQHGMQHGMCAPALAPLRHDNMAVRMACTPQVDVEAVGEPMAEYKGQCQPVFLFYKVGAVTQHTRARTHTHAHTCTHTDAHRHAHARMVTTHDAPWRGATAHTRAQACKLLLQANKLPRPTAL